MPPALLRVGRIRSVPVARRRSRFHHARQSRAKRGSDPVADFDGLDRLQRHDCASEQPSRRSSQLTYVPRPGGTSCATTSKTPPTESPVLQNLVDFVLHALLGFGVGAVQQNLSLLCQRRESFPRSLLAEREPPT